MPLADASGTPFWRTKEPRMQIDLQQFLSRLAGAVVLSLVPVVITTFTTMPSAFHHHLGTVASATHVTPTHMT